MTEREWLACDQPADLARFLHGTANGLRFRFLAVAWGYRIRDYMVDYDLPWFDAFAGWVSGTGEPPHAVCRQPEFVCLEYGAGPDYWARRCVDAIRDKDPLTAAACAGEGAARISLPRQPEDTSLRGESNSKRAAREARLRAEISENKAHQLGVRSRFCAEFRDVAGDPFRPVVFAAEWRTSTAVDLAQLMYESRDFSAMPILADALQDAGCANDDILNHCRGPGPHVRGCWVVDLVLGKV
jgi:hypothetical protein